jgi:nitrogen regulatory protein PII
MNTTSLKKMTIVAERLLRESLLKLLREVGATGYTMTAVEGAGSRGVNAGDFEGRNVQIETIVSAKVAEAILNRIAAEYLENYAVIAYVSDVDVLRGGKFSSEGS